MDYKKVIVCVTAQQSCKKLISSCKKLISSCKKLISSCKKLISSGSFTASEENAKLNIVCVLPESDCFCPDVSVLVDLNEASLEYNAEMTVFFSDSPVEKIVDTAKSLNASMIVTGIPGKNSTSFIAILHKKIPNIPICMVDSDGTVYRIGRNNQEAVPNGIDLNKLMSRTN